MVARSAAILFLGFAFVLTQSTVAIRKFLKAVRSTAFKNFLSLGNCRYKKGLFLALTFFM
jgi:hypothetical protein